MIVVFSKTNYHGTHRDDDVMWCDVMLLNEWHYLVKKTKRGWEKGDSFPEEHLTGKNCDMPWYLRRVVEEHGNDENMQP